MRSRFRPGIRQLAAVLLAAWAGAAGIARAAPARPAAGRFLVATRQVQGGFAESVILLIDAGETGAMGLIVNRPTKLALEKLLPEIAELRGRQDPVYVGGPVSPDHLMLLIRSKTAPPGAGHVLGDVYASGSAETLRALAGGKIAGARFRAYVGYAGWAAGQLDFEIARGDWLVVPADAAGVFTDHPSDLWKQLIRQQGGVQVELERRLLALR